MSLSRRAVLGSAAGIVGAGLLPPVAAQASSTSLIDLRRDIHAHPETAGNEERTARIVARRLRAAGLAVTTGIGGHGVLAVLTGGRRGRTVAYRADMDAVPPEAQFGGGPDPAHVCGHDLHTTIGVGVAESLARSRNRLAGTVAFVFQPAEETLSGAAAMLADGVFDRVRPAEIHALHCGPWPAGQLVVMPGYGLPGQDYGSITVTDENALVRAEQLAAAINALGTVAPPGTPEELEQLITDLETPDGPLVSFVFMQAFLPAPETPEVRFFYRCWPEERYVAVRAEIQRLAAPAAVVLPAAPFPAMVNPVRESRALRRHLRQTIGTDRVGTLYASPPFNGEDFALFLNRMPGTYSFLGVRRPGAPIESGYPHFGSFTPDERAIGFGVRAMAGWLATRTRD